MDDEQTTGSAPATQGDSTPPAASETPPAASGSDTRAPASFDWSSVPADAWDHAPTEGVARARRNPEVNRWWQSEVGRTAADLAEQRAQQMYQEQWNAWQEQQAAEAAAAETAEALYAPPEVVGQQYQQELADADAEAYYRSQYEQEFWPAAEQQFRQQLGAQLFNLFESPEMDLSQADKQHLWQMSTRAELHEVVTEAHKRARNNYGRRELRAARDQIAREERALARGDEIPFDTTIGGAAPIVSDAATVARMSPGEFMRAYRSGRFALPRAG